MKHIITLSLLIAAVLLIRALFRKHISPKVTYALWLLVVIKLCIPFSLFSVELQTLSTPQNETVQQNTDSRDDMSLDPVIIAPQHEIKDSPSYDTDIQESITSPLQAEAQDSTATIILPSENNELSGVLPSAAGKQSTDARSMLPEISLKTLLTLLWLIGSEAVAIWFISTVLIFDFRVRRDRAEIGRYKGIRVFISESAETPCLHGIIPAIYLTSEANASTDKELILEHEYTHLRHGDSLWAIIRITALILLWWNPLIWAAALLSKQDSELACDYEVTKALDEIHKKSYAYMIISLIPKKHTVATGFANNSIKERMIMMTKRNKNRIFAAFLAVVLAFAAAGCSFIGLKETVSGGDILPSAEDEFEKLYIYRYDGEKMYTAGAMDKKDASEFISSLYLDTLEPVDSFKHSMVKGDIYGIRIIGEGSSAYAWTNGYLITDSGKAYKYKKDIASLADKYFARESEGERITKYFPCLRYIAMDGNSWDVDFMPRATTSERNYQIDNKPFEPTIEHFFGEEIVLYDKCDDGSIRTARGAGQTYDMYVMIDARWYDVPINESDYKEVEWKSYRYVGDKMDATPIITATVNTCVNSDLSDYGRYSVDVPLDTPDGYYKLNILGNDLEFSVDQKERQRIAAADDIDTAELEGVISSLIPSIVPNTEIGDGYNFFSHRISGMERDGDILTVYILGHYSEFHFDDVLIIDQSMTFPAILKFKETEKGYTLTDKASAFPWSDLEYEMSVNAWNSLRSIDFNIMLWEAYKNAAEHFGFDPTETVEENIDAYLQASIADTSAVYSSSVSSNFQKNSSNTELINYGEYTMKYICEQIMSGREMIGVYGDYIKELILNLTHYMPASDVNTKEYFYDVYVAAWHMRNTDEELTRKYFPMMLAITECIAPNVLRDPNGNTNVIKTYLITSDSEYLFSYSDNNKGIELEFYSSKEDPRKYKVGYYDSDGDLVPSLGHNIVGTYTYDSALPIYAGSEGLELFYILKMTSGDDIYYLKFVSSIAGKHNGVNYPTFGLSGEISEAEVNRLLEAQKG